MPGAVRILLWEQFRQTWLAGVVAVTAMFLPGAFIHSNDYGPDNFILVTAFVTLAFLFIRSSREGLTFAFPQRQFTLPISTVSLLNVLLVYRLCAISCVGAVLCAIQSELYSNAPPLIAFVFILCLATLWTQTFVCLLSLFESWKALVVLFLFLGLILGMSGMPEVCCEKMFQRYWHISPILQNWLYIGSLLFSLMFWSLAVKTMRTTFPKKTANILSLVLLVALVLGKVCVYTSLGPVPFTALARLLVEYMVFSAQYSLLTLVKSAAGPVSLLLLAGPAGYIGALWALTHSRNRRAFQGVRPIPNIGWTFQLPEWRGGEWSPLRAQLWYEWRQTYHWLPYLMIPTVIVLMAMIFGPGRDTHYIKLSIVIFTGVASALGVGYFGMRKSAPYASSVFTKPVSITTLCRAKLWAGLAGVIPAFVLLALVGASFCFMSLPQDRRAMMTGILLYLALILLLMFGALYLGRVALAYLCGYFLTAVSIMEMLEQSGYASKALGYVLMTSGLLIPLVLGLWMVYWVWRRRVIPHHHALITMVTVPGAILIAGILMFSKATPGFYRILWFNVLVLMVNTFALVWVPWVLYRQRHR